MAKANRKYKDRLFKFIFGNPSHKEWTLMLYNAVNGTQYQNAEDIELTTIEDAIYMGMKNDVSFIFCAFLNLFEQESSFNRNMPMRFLIYAGMQYAKFVETDSSYFRFSSALQKAPTPKCVCFYNGIAEKEDKIILKLSDSFDFEGDIDVRVTMLNINYGHNKKLMESCRPLWEYSWFTDKVRKGDKNKRELIKAINHALQDMPDDFAIKPFLIANKAEVTSMCITEYNEARVRREMRKEAKAEGRAEGRAEGSLMTLIALVKDGDLSLEKAAKRSGMTMEEFKKKMGESS